MAENQSGGGKTNVNVYTMLGGVNQKASEYTVGLAQFLNIRNMDFDVPTSLNKRPGSTQAISANTSGPSNSLFEYQRLDGSSWIVAGSDTAMFYRISGGLTLLSPGWNNGQPTDMLTFVNRLWMASGQKYEGWSGVGSTAIQVGLPCNASTIEPSPRSSTGGSWFLAGGATMFFKAAFASYILRGVYFAYSYVRNDGYYGPADFLSSARNVIPLGDSPATSGNEFFAEGDWNNIGGFTVPAGLGVSAVAVWVGVDTISVGTTNREVIQGQGATPLATGDLGWQIGAGGNLAMSVTLKPGADLTRFHLYTLIAPGTFFLTDPSGTGSTTWASTLIPNYNFYTGPASGAAAFSGVPFCWFNTNTPKYIDINQNSMFMSGFSNAPSVMWFSEVGEPENLQPESFFEVRTNDGDRITGHKTYNNDTIVFKENSFHKIIGNNADNYELVELSTEYGCLSNQAIIEFKEKLLFLDRKGIVEYNGASWDVISTPVEDIFRQMNLSAAREKACAVHHLYRNQVWFGIPIGNSTVNNVTVVFDYLVNAWTFFDGFNPASFSFIQGGLTRPTAWRGDYSGLIHYHSESLFGDNGQGITCLAYTSWEHSQQNETWIWRRFFLDVAPATGLTGVINGKLYSSYNTSTVQATFSMFQDQFQSRFEMGVVGKAQAVEFSHFSASLPLLINGYSWARRFLRNV